MSIVLKLILSGVSLYLLIENAKRSYEKFVMLGVGDKFFAWEVFQVLLFWGLSLYILWVFIPQYLNAGNKEENPDDEM